MKILLLGPYPPPHGGVSVHVAELRRRLEGLGIRCRVANIDTRAPESGRYISVRGAWDLVSVLRRYAGQGWMVHLHTNGHSLKSWTIALVCGLAGRLGPGCALTLHSGMTPAYLKRAAPWSRLLSRMAGRLYDVVIAVNEEISDAMFALGIPAHRLEVLPAFLAAGSVPLSIPASLEERLVRHKPLLAATLFFRPEYGFELLVAALLRLRRRYPALGCVVMGSGERQAEARALIEREQLQDCVVMPGDVAHETCLALMSRADVFVRPSLVDGDAISVREALSLGTAVAASNVGTRPAGTLLFEAGNVEQMVAAIEKGLAKRRGCVGTGIPARPDGHLLELLEIYRRIAHPGAATVRKESWKSSNDYAA